MSLNGIVGLVLGSENGAANTLSTPEMDRVDGGELNLTVRTLDPKIEMWSSSKFQMFLLNAIENANDGSSPVDANSLYTCLKNPYFFRVVQKKTIYKLTEVGAVISLLIKILIKNPLGMPPTDCLDRAIIIVQEQLKKELIL